MKVIGKSEDGYLIQASESDIANLFGFGWSGEEKYKQLLKDELGDYRARNGNLIGLEIKASVAYRRLSWLRKRASEFDRLCKQLRSTAEMIEQHEPLFDAIAADKDEAA